MPSPTLRRAVAAAAAAVASVAAAPPARRAGLSAPGVDWSAAGTFDPRLPVEEASTLPSAWYTREDIFQAEQALIFGRRWLAVGHSEQVQKPGDYFTGSLGNVRYIVCKDQQGRLGAFHNVCRHHAAAVAAGAGSASSFVCPYHESTGLDIQLGWAIAKGYALSRDTEMFCKGKQEEMGLKSIQATVLGKFILLRLDETLQGMPLDGKLSIQDEWLGQNDLNDDMAASLVNLAHVHRDEYVINCNWKVFCDNYLDGVLLSRSLDLTYACLSANIHLLGGYHVAHAHKDLAEGLDLQSYTTKLYDKISIQTCQSKGIGKDDARLGACALYIFVYPNFMINRYGPWMDTNAVIPLTPTTCRVIFDYFLDHSLTSDEAYVERSIASSSKVQEEDSYLCERVQEGLQSPAYDVGRYAPRVEQAMYHFHKQVHEDLHS
eukprot:SM000013S26376  [mRNA]  locus=s13:37953:41540:- [translate_table: standard]